MSKEYHIEYEAGSFGDIISATTIFRSGRKGSLTLTDEPRLRRIAPLFSNTCEIHFIPAVKQQLPLAGWGSMSKRILAGQGIVDYGIPEIIVSPENLSWAREWLKDKPKPIIINGVTGTNQSDHPLKNYRKIPRPIMEDIVKTLIQLGCTPLSFGVKDNVEIFGNEISTPDLPIDKVAAIYVLAGKYVGCDTGDYHLMVAVGGKALVLVPPSAAHYDYRLHHYTYDCFPEGIPRAGYIPFEDYKTVIKAS